MTTPGSGTRIATSAGNGVTTAFGVPFKYISNSDLYVYLADTATPDLDVLTPLTEGVHYTVSGDGPSITAQVDMVTPPASGEYLIRYRRTSKAQTADYVASDGFPAASHETQLDRLSLVDEELAADADAVEARCLRVPAGETLDTLPAQSSIGTKLWGFLAGVSNLFTPLSLAALIAPYLPADLKGDPGANVMAIGLFTAGPSLSIPIGTDAVWTSGHSIPGYGSARYVLTEDEDHDAAWVAAHPNIAFTSANGRTFILDQTQLITDGMIGCLPDCDQDAFTGTDIAPLLEEFWDAFTYNVDFDLISCGPEIHFGHGDFLLGSELEPRQIVKIYGTASGHNNFIGGTRWHSPEDTRAITINVNNSGGGEKLLENAGTAEGSEIVGIQFISQGGTDPEACAVWLRGRANVEKCVFGELRNADLTKGKWPGDGILILANSGSTGRDYGNANNWRVRDCYAERVAGHGLFVSGTDANAGSCIGFETRLCGGCGILDISGLGNTYSDYNLAGYANSSPLKGRVTHGGRHYQLISMTADIGGATEPGTNNNIWYDMGAGATWPAWISLAAYSPDIPILCLGDSNRSKFSGGYSEGGTSHVAAPAIAVAGQMGFTNTSSVLQQNQIGTVNAILAPTGMGGAVSYLSGQPGHSAMGEKVYTIVGSIDPAGITGGRGILEHRRAAALGVAMHWHWSGEDMICRFVGQKNYFRMTGPLSTTTFGRASAVPYIFGVPQLAIIDPNTLGNSRIMNVCATIPASGEVAKGERYWMNNAAGGGFAEEYCTTGGVLGSTAVMKTCNPISA